MVISRVLTPEELGGYSLAIGSIAIGQVLRDFGLSLYLVQTKEISDKKSPKLLHHFYHSLLDNCYIVLLFILIYW